MQWARAALRGNLGERRRRTARANATTNRPNAGSPKKSAGQRAANRPPQTRRALAAAARVRRGLGR
eukprot:8767494-Lingulodinium_polyedra.AAC.1